MPMSISEQERFSKLESSVAVLDTKMDNTTKLLDDMRKMLENQTVILSKFLVLEERHNNFENELKLLKNDYKMSKEEFLKAIGAFRAIVFSGAIFVSTVVGLGLYIYNDKIEVLERHEQILTANNNK
jgi:hypothetical protein